MLVDAHVSSMKTRFSTVIVGCASIHAWRACCTSSRSCSLACRVFFEGKAPLVQLMPERPDLDRDALFGQSKLQLSQSQIGLGGDPVAQLRFRLSQPRLAVAAEPDLTLAELQLRLAEQGVSI